MRRILLFLLGFIVLVVVGVVALLTYIRPASELDLAYEEVGIADKVAEMMLRRELAVEITQEDLNNLLKKKLARQPEISPGVRVAGADFTLQDGVLTGDVSLLYRDSLPVGARVVYVLQWQNPRLIAEFRGARVKALQLPNGWLSPEPYILHLDDLLPPVVSVKDVRLEGDRVRIELKGVLPLGRG